MALEDLEYRDYLRIFVRRWPLVLGGAVLGSALGFAAAKFQTPEPTYMATTTTRFDPGKAFDLSSGAGGTLNEQSEAVYDTAVIANAARRLGEIEPGIDEEVALRDHLPALVRVANRLVVEVRASGETGLVKISAIGPTPEEAVRASTAIAQAYREENLGDLRFEISRRRQIVERKLAENEAAMNDTQLEYELFRRRHPQAATGPGLAGFLQSLSVHEERQQALAQKIDESHRQISILRRGRPISDLGLEIIVARAANSRITKLSNAYTDFRIQRDALLTELTPAHPRVLQIDEQLAGLRSELTEELQLLIDSFEQKQSEEAAALEELLEQEERTAGSRAREAMQIAHLARRVRVFENVEMQLRSELEDAILKDSSIRGQVEILTPATLPREPVEEAQIGRLMGLGLLGGAFIAFVIAILLEGLRFGMDSVRHLEEALDVAVLGVCPAIRNDEPPLAALGRRLAPDSVAATRSLALAALTAPRSAIAEATRTLRVSLESLVRGGTRAFTVTSSRGGEGATTTTLNLALSFAQTGRTVLVVEANFHHPCLATWLDVESEPGLAEVLLGSARIEEATRTLPDLLTGTISLDDALRAPGLDGVSVIVAGNATTYPGDPFGGRGFVSFLEDVRRRYDVVLLDTAGLKIAVDAVVLGRQAPVLLVFDPRRASRGAVATSLAEFEKTETDVAGLYVNGLEVDFGRDRDERSLRAV